MQPPVQQVVKRTRISVLRVALALCAVVLLLLVFILDSQRVDVGHFGAHGHPAAGVAPLLAPYLGMLLALIAGFGRMAQRRTTARRNGKI